MKNKIVADNSLLSGSTYGVEDTLHNFPPPPPPPGVPMSSSQPTPVSDSFSNYFSSSISTSSQDSRSLPLSASLPTPVSQSYLNQIPNSNKIEDSTNAVVFNSNLISDQIKIKTKSTPPTNLENYDESKFGPKIMQKSNIISNNKLDESAYNFIQPSSKDNENYKNMNLNSTLNFNRNENQNVNVDVDISAYVRSSSIEFESESNSELESVQSLLSSKSSSVASSKSSSNSCLELQSKGEIEQGRESDKRVVKIIDDEGEENIKKKKEEEDRWKNESGPQSHNYSNPIELFNPSSLKALPWDALKLSISQQVTNSIEWNRISYLTVNYNIFTICKLTFFFHLVPS